MKQAATPKAKVTKPYLKGEITDRNTGKRALGFLGLLLTFTFVSVLACSMFLFDNTALRIGLNGIVWILILTICFMNGSTRGTEDVAKGEVMYQHRENGKEDEAGERATAYHPLKGFATAVIGSLLILICAIILAATAEKTITGIGALPSWLETYRRRSEIGDALAAYGQTASVTVTGAVRTVVRLFLMPIVSMIGTENKDALLLTERLSPILVLLPAVFYGIGYLRGPATRSAVHTEISENIRKRKKKEHREQKKRMAVVKEPEQLN